MWKQFVCFQLYAVQLYQIRQKYAFYYLHLEIKYGLRR